MLKISSKIACLRQETSKPLRIKYAAKFMIKFHKGKDALHQSVA